MAQEEEPDISKLLAQANAAYNNFNIADEGGMNDDIQLTAEDMNDPDLLAELAEFSDSEGGELIAETNDNNDGDEKVFEEMQIKSLQSLKQKMSMVQAKCNQFQSSSDSNNYSLSQKLLKELKFLYSQINKMDAIEFATDKDEIDVQIKQVYDKISSISLQPHSTKKMKSQHQSKQSADLQNQINIAVGDGDQEASEQLLLQRYKMYKFAAKKSKDEGDKQTAIQYLKQSKIIAKYVEQIRQGVVIWQSDLPPILADGLWNISVKKSPQPVAKVIVQKQLKVSAPPVLRQISEEQRELNEMYATPQQVESRIQHYKIACVSAKKDGNISAAKVYLREFKELQKMLPFVRSGEIKPKLKDLPPEIRDGHVHINKKQTAPVQKAPPKPQRRRLSATEQGEYTKIIKRLRLQIEECKSDASFLQTDDDNQAQMLLKYAKESHVMLQKVMQCQKLELETPKYEMFSIKVKSLNINNDIEENELRLIIGKLSNLATKGSTDVYLTLKIDNLCDITTPSKKVKFSVDFGIKKRCKIERNKRLKNKIKFGKLNICLYQKNFFSDVLLGQAVLKLKALLEQSSIKETVVIKPENERKKMADLQIVIKLRKPVLTEGHTVITKQLIKITHFPVVKKQQIVVKKKVETKPQQAAVHGKQQQRRQSANKKPVSVAPTMQKPVAKQIVKAKKAVVKNNNNLPNGLTQEMVDNPLGIEYIESFECISKGIENCQQEILKKGGKNCQDIQDRLQGLSTAKTVLEVQVNNGLLTLEDYTNRVKKAMITDLALAKYLKTQNRKIEAVKVLQRYKLMKKEIEGT